MKYTVHNGIVVSILLTILSCYCLVEGGEKRKAREFTLPSKIEKATDHLWAKDTML